METVNKLDAIVYGVVSSSSVMLTVTRRSLGIIETEIVHNSLALSVLMEH